MESSEGFSRREEKCAVHFSGDTDNDALVCTRQDQVEIIEERARQWICLEPPKLPEKAIADNFLQNILLSSSLPPSATTSSTSSSSVVATARSSSRPASASIASVPSSRVDDGVSHTQADKYQSQESNTIGNATQDSLLCTSSTGPRVRRER